MPSASSIIAKVNRAIKKVGPMARTSYLRATTVTAGDQLTGVGIVTTTVDTLLSPQPVYKQLNKREIMYISAGTVQLVADDYKFVFPVGQATKAMFQATNAQLLLVDANGYENLKILYIDSAMFGGSDVVITVFARSVGYQSPGGFMLLENGNDTLLLEDGSSTILLEK